MPVVSGYGVAITGWAAVSGASPPVFKASLPRAQGDFVRLLWTVDGDVHGEQTRVRLPRLTAEGVASSCGGESGKYSGDPALAGWDGDAPAVGCREVTLPSSEVVHLDPIGSFGKAHKGYVANSSAPLHWRNIGDVEFVFTHSGNPWTESRCTVASVKANGTCANGTGACTAILLKEPCWSSAIGASGPDFNALLPSRIEQVMPVGDPPTLAPPLAKGHFYADRAEAALYYWPSDASSGSPPALWTVGCNATTLLHGTDGVRGHTFSGIKFELGGTWNGSNTDEGMVGYQAAYHNVPGYGATWGAGFHCKMWHNQTHDCWKMLAPVPAAIHFQHAQSVSFQDCSFHHMGIGAVWFDEGSQNCLVDRCTFGDVSGAAVMFGGIQDFGETDTARQTHGNVLHNSTISRVAVEYHGSAGVLVGWATSTVISHNEIANLSYSGISLGWGWGQASYQANNSVHHNNIHHVMCGDLIDGGPIYTLGPQPNSSLHHNYLHHICNMYGMLYHDSGSEGFHDHSNVCSESPGLWWILINGDGDGNDVTDNFIDASCKTTYAACSKGDAPSHCNTGPNPLAMPTNCTANCSCHCSVHSNTFVAAPSDFPAAARAIMADAGPMVWDSWSVEFSAPVILHGVFKVNGSLGKVTLDGNQSMVDTFYALNRTHLFGMYEIAYEHVARPMVESTDGGSSWQAAGSAVCHPVNNDGGKPCYEEQALARQPDGSLRSLGDLKAVNISGSVFGFRSSGFTAFSQGANGRLAIDYSHAKTSPVFFEGLPRPIPMFSNGTSSTKCFEGAGWDTPFASVVLPDGSTLMASPVCYGDVKTTYDKTIGASSLVAWRSLSRSSYKYVGTIVAAQDAVPEMSTRGVTQEIDMALMADGKTVMVVIRIDGDGRCGMGDGPGPCRPYYASYSADFGSSWSLAVPLKGTGCKC
jgi:hypothetical protein